MYTRSFECSFKPEKREEFTNAVRGELLPILQKQAGFADLLCLLSAENLDHCFLMTFWISQSDADNFFQRNAPVTELLKPYLKEHKIENFYVESSTLMQVAAAKAA
ncbi:MAG: antibiotic biosynthesis monooxygenase [Terriglobales bacterium]